MNNTHKKATRISKEEGKTVGGPGNFGTKKRRAVQAAMKKNIESETKEERERRLAILEALTIRAFQMAYDNYHRQ